MAFYYPKRTKPIDWARMGMQLYNIKTQADLTEKELAMRKTRSDAEYGESFEFPGGRPGRPDQRQTAVRKSGLAERRVSAGEGALALAELKHEDEEQTVERKWERDMAGPPKDLEMRTMLKKFPEFGPVLNPILAAIDKEEITDRYGVWGALSRTKAMGGFAPIQEKLRNKAMKLKEEGKDDEAQQYAGLATAIGKNGFLKQYFNVPPKRISALDRMIETAEMGFQPEGLIQGLTKPKKQPSEKEQLQVQITDAQLRSKLTNPDEMTDVESYKTYGVLFNSRNKNNEVAYWDSGLVAGKVDKWYYDEGIRIIKLPAADIKNGWTPARIQEAANNEGITVEAFLLKHGVLKKK